MPISTGVTDPEAEAETPPWADGWDEELDWDWSEVDPVELGLITLDPGAGNEIDCGGSAMRSFTRANFRHNLKVQTRSVPSNSHAHHTFPVKYESWFKSRGLNIHNPAFGTWWASSSHLQNATAWNAEWRRFINANPNASMSAIKSKGRTMLSRYGLRIWY